MRLPLLAKAAALGFIALVLIWALDAVTRVVAERQGRLQEAQRSVADSLASSQSLLGPVLHRSCTESWEVEAGEGKLRTRTTEQRTFALRATPRRLDVDGVARLEPRYRGIFKVNGYVLKATLAAEWSDTSALEPKPTHDKSKLTCDAPVLWIAVNDARGLRDVRLSVQDRETAVAPGTPSPVLATGLQATLPDSVLQPGTPLRATAEIELAGTSAFALAPVGESTQAKLVADWPHPSFNGRFLPAARAVSESGFDATWRVGALASRASQEVLTGGALCRPDGPAWTAHTAGNPAESCIETFGVSFFDPVNPYVLGDRATKYGLLFIGLTFVTLALVEVMRRVRVHPVQYLLVGCALVLFFLLLVSLSEHVPFLVAYLAASAGCTALIAYYGSFVLKSLRGGLALGGGIALLYGALYLLLLREQTALVLGALLLFAVLAAVMRVTRNVDWHAVLRTPGRDEAPAAN